MTTPKAAPRVVPGLEEVYLVCDEYEGRLYFDHANLDPRVAEQIRATKPDPERYHVVRFIRAPQPKPKPRRKR